MSGRDLQDLFEIAQRAGNEGDSASDFEPAFTEVLEYIQRNPECRAEALALMSAAIHGAGSLPWELLAFLMHELRWPEVKEEAIKLIRESEDWRVKTPLYHVIAAFESEWCDADIYERWREPPST